MTLDVTLDIEPMTLDVEMGEIYDVTGDEFERGYSEGYEVGVGSVAAGMVTSYKSDRIAQVRSYAFYGCSQLTSIDLPLVFTIQDSAFSYCSRLTSVELPLAGTIGQAAFYGCLQLTSVELPRADYIGRYAFSGCSRLTSVDFSLKVTIGASAFDDCTRLTTLILRANEVCNLSSTSAFTYTPIKSGTGCIYVPNDLVGSYKAATNWSTYAAQIKPLSELEG